MIYVYRCSSRHEQELQRKVHDRDALVICQKCKLPMRRVLAPPPAFYFKGGKPT